MNKKIGVIIIDTENYVLANNALVNTINKINPSHVLTYTDNTEIWNNYDKKIIKKINSIEDYNQIILSKIANDIVLNHYLIIQYDGFAINENNFNQIFFEYDYIGAPWPQFSENNVGNGGFSLRSKKLIEAAANIASKRAHNEAEDIFLCRTAHRLLNDTYKINYASEQIAKSFSFESPFSKRNTFGFHGLLNLPIIYSESLDFLFDNLSPRILNRKNELIYGLMNSSSKNAEKFIMELIKK